MPFQVSPGVNVSEIDLTTIVPAVATTEGAIAGVFKWGPVEERVLISNEDELVNVYGKPTSNNHETFFVAANFLSYGNQLYVSRAASGAYNATVNNDVLPVNNILIKGPNDYEANKATYDSVSYDNLNFAAKYPGDLGNSLKISICADADSYESVVKGYAGANSSVLSSNSQTTFSISVGSAVANVSVRSLVDTAYANIVASDVVTKFNVGDLVLVGDTTTGTQYMQIASISSVYNDPSVPNPTSLASFTLTFTDTYKQKSAFTKTVAANTTAGDLVTRNWEYFNLVDAAPRTSNYVATRVNTTVYDEVHIVVTDEDGKISGLPGQVLEVWSNLSRATDAKSDQGNSIYYRDVLNNSSRFVWSTRDYLGSSPTRDNFAALNIVGPQRFSFAYGQDGSDETSIDVANINRAYDQFKSAEEVDISLVLCGKARGGIGETVANYVIDNICEVRKDCVAFVSPDINDVVNVPNLELTNITAFRNVLRSTSYAVLDSGYKYQYDKYNDLYRWVPLNGDIAGLCVRTDSVRDPWFSPAGFNRGNIKNIVKLAYNPDKADRDVLYRAGINPVVNFPGQGTILYGDKTLLARPSAFDRINVRRLFIVLEKAIARAAQSALFEFNDDFTRAAFRNLVEPYLRDIQGRRGIYDFKVVCDTTNNTPEVIDRNEFRGDIYIKPARSINFIQLNFVAVRTGVEFEEIVGRF